MVCLPDDLPLLQLNNQELVPCDLTWIVNEIAKAAKKAGRYEAFEWAIHNEMSDALELYLTNRFEGRFITLQQITERITAMLALVGLTEVIGLLEITAPPARVSLLDLAHGISADEEDKFFAKLSERLDLFEESARRYIVCEEFRPAVELIRGHGRWTTSCDALAGRISDFLDAEVPKRFPSGVAEFVIR